MLLDHGTGMVIGETCVVGFNCSFLHGVTLGSSGKEVGDRHPKVGNNVLIGCNAIVLGNIRVGDSCKIGSGSVLVKSIADGTTAVGNPARVIGMSTDTNAAANMDFALRQVQTLCGTPYFKSWSLNADGSGVFEEVDVDRRGVIDASRTIAALTLRFGMKPPELIVHEVFAQMDSDFDGMISKEQFESLSKQLLAYGVSHYATTQSTGSSSSSSSSFSEDLLRERVTVPQVGQTGLNSARDISSFMVGASLAASGL